MLVKNKKIFKILGFSFFIFAIFAIISFFVYVSNYYEAYTLELNNTYVHIQEKDNLTVFVPDLKDNNTGIIFYPGGKVEARAYYMFLSQLSEKGYTTVLVEMPFNLAVFNSSAATNIIYMFPEIDTWYIAGHSLGGAMASHYVSQNKNKIDGLILLGAFVYGDIGQTPTLIIYGSQDKVLDTSKIIYGDNIEIMQIEGGNHAGFAHYGPQSGDGVATISREKQQEITINAIHDFINKTSGVKPNL